MWGWRIAHKGTRHYIRDHVYEFITWSWWWHASPFLSTSGIWRRPKSNVGQVKRYIVVAHVTVVLLAKRLREDSFLQYSTDCSRQRIFCTLFHNVFGRWYSTDCCYGGFSPNDATVTHLNKNNPLTWPFPLIEAAMLQQLRVTLEGKSSTVEELQHNIESDTLKV